MRSSKVATAMLLSTSQTWSENVTLEPSSACKPSTALSFLAFSFLLHILKCVGPATEIRIVAWLLHIVSWSVSTSVYAVKPETICYGTVIVYIPEQRTYIPLVAKSSLSLGFTVIRVTACANCVLNNSCVAHITQHLDVKSSRFVAKIKCSVPTISISNWPL